MVDSICVLISIVAMVFLIRAAEARSRAEGEPDK